MQRCVLMTAQVECGGDTALQWGLARWAIWSCLPALRRLQYEGFRRREETNAAIMKLAADGAPTKEIRASHGL